MKITKTLAAWMLVLLTMALPAGAQVKVGTGAALKPGHAEGELYGWSGPAPKLKLVAEYLAKATVLMQADGDLDQAQELVRGVWKRAASQSEFKEQQELLVEVALLRAEIHRRQGDLTLALRAAEQVLFQAEDIKRIEARSKDVSVAKKALRAVALKAQADLRLVQLRETLGAMNKVTEDDTLEGMVRDAFASRNFMFIEEIGAPAQAAFAREILAHAEEFPANFKSDPLHYFLRMNERQAAQLLLANLNQAGYLWKRRVVRAMTSGDVLNNRGTWSTEAPYVCLEPEWLSVLEALLSSQETALQSVALIEEPFLRDQFSPGIQHALVYGIENYPLEFVNAVLQAMDHGGVVDSAKPVFEAAARHTVPGVRRIAARALANYESSSVLRSMASDADEEVRASVARTLGPHEGLEIRRYLIDRDDDRWGTNHRSREYNSAPGEEERALLRQFAGDPSWTVRVAAAEALVNLKPPLDYSVYLDLARDENYWVRHQIASAGSLPPEDHGKLLLQLARDSSSSVIIKVDDALREVPLATAPGPYLDAIRVRFLNPQIRMRTSNEVLMPLIQSPLGLAAYSSWVHESDSSRLREEFFNGINNTQPTGFEKILDLDDAALGRIFLMAHKSTAYFLQMVRGAIQNARPSRGAAMRSILRDASINTALRLNAAELAAPVGGDEFRDDLLGLLSDPAWKSNPPTQSDLRQLQNVMTYMPESDRNEIVLGAVRSTTTPNTLAQQVAEHYSTASPLGREITLAILDRWFTPDALPVEAVVKAIGHLAVLPADAPPELLRVIATSPHPSYSYAAIETIVALHREEDLPTLELCLGVEWIVNIHERQGLRNAAVQGVVTYLSEQAAEIMLRGLGSPERLVRKACADGLDALELSRERQRRWAEKGQAQPTEESALAELLAMLDHENLEIRVQAIRGISTFGAIEYLPTLIRLLADPEPRIVEAARMAIDTLSHTGTKKPQDSK